MKARQLLVSSAAATSCMTAFSYLVSNLKKENFREPALLAVLASNVHADLAGSVWAKPVGWLSHYVFGAAWSPLQYGFHRIRKSKASNKEAASFGVFGGLTAALAWHLMFKLAKFPPENRRGHFYRHLILAHIVYSLSFWQLIKKDITDQADQTPRFLPAHIHAKGIL